MSIEHRVAQLHLAAVAWLWGDDVATVAQVGDRAPVGDERANLQRIAVDIAKAFEQVHSADRVVGVMRAVRQFGFCTRQRRGVVDAVDVERLQSQADAALAVRDGVGQRNWAVVVGSRCECEGAVPVVRDVAMVGDHGTNAQRAAFYVAVPCQQISSVQDIGAIFQARDQCRWCARQNRRVVDGAQAQCLLGRCAAALAIAHGVGQHDGAVVVGSGREGVVEAVSAKGDGAVGADYIDHAERAAVYVAVALEQLCSSKDVGRVFRACDQNGLRGAQHRRVVDTAKTEGALRQGAGALAVEHVVAQRHRTVVIEVWLHREGAVFVVNHHAIVSLKVVYAERAAVNIRVTRQQFFGTYRVGRVFHTIGQVGCLTARCVIHAREAEGLARRSDATLTVQNVVSQGDGTVVVRRRGKCVVDAIGVAGDGAMVRDWHADAQAVAFHIAVALEQLRGSKAVDRVFRACSQRGRLSRQRRRVVDAAQTDRLGCCDDPAVTVYHAVAQLERTVVVLCRGDRESAVTVVFDAAVVGTQGADAEPVTLHIVVTHKKVLRFEDISRVFTTCGQYEWCGTERWRVIGAGDGDCHRLCNAIHRPDGETVRVFLAGGELVVSAGHGVGPLAVGIQTKLAVAVVTGHIRLNLELHRRAQHVTGCQHTTRYFRSVTLIDRSTGSAANHGGVVCAVDPDCQRLSGSLVVAVPKCVTESLHQAVARGQLLNDSQVVVQGVAVGAIRVGHQGTVFRRLSSPGDEFVFQCRVTQRVIELDVAQIGGCRRGGVRFFGDGQLVCRRHRGIVGAVDGDA